MSAHPDFLLPFYRRKIPAAHTMLRGGFLWNYSAFMVKVKE